MVNGHASSKSIPRVDKLVLYLIFLFQQEILGKKIMFMFLCVVLLFRKPGKLELLPSVQIQLQAISFLFLPEEVKLLKLAKNIQDDEIITVNTGV